MLIAQATSYDAPAGLSSGDALGMLGFLVALVTYTQAASHFLRERINGLSALQRDGKFSLHLILFCVTVLDFAMVMLGLAFLWRIWLPLAIAEMCPIWTMAFAVLLTLLSLLHGFTWWAGLRWARRDLWPPLREWCGSGP